MARLDQMATIQNYLNPPAQPTNEQSDTVPDVPIAPGINAPAPLTSLTADQKRAFDANRQAQKDIELSRKEALEAAMAADQAKKDAFEASARTTIGAVRHIGQSANITLSGIPLPGGLTFPIVVLVFFFALLLPVNGHTRLTWLWLVLSNNAHIGGPQTTGSDTSATNGATNANQGSGTTGSPPIIQPTGLPIMPLLSFSGVQEID